MMIITLGDPFSINVESIRPLLHQKPRFPTLLIGSLWHWNNQLQRANLPDLPMAVIKTLRGDFNEPGNFFYDVGGEATPAESLGPKARGTIAADALHQLHHFSWPGHLAVLTCPIDKSAAALAGFKFSGQTEFFQNLWHGPGIMFLCGSKLKVGLITNHLPLSDVERSISPELIAEKVAIADQTLRDIFGIETPRIALCGLNPHCGDGGLFGDFDQRIVAPTVKSLAEKFSVSGPLPADTVFWRALQGVFDCVLAMYHDQGLGPLKTVHFDDAINLTGGLCHLRVSPDHGPASDLFLTGRASNRSFELCMKTLTEYLHRQSSAKGTSP